MKASIAAFFGRILRSTCRPDVMTSFAELRFVLTIFPSEDVRSARQLLCEGPDRESENLETGYHLPHYEIAWLPRRDWTPIEDAQNGGVDEGTQDDGHKTMGVQDSKIQDDGCPRFRTMGSKIQDDGCPRFQDYWPGSDGLTALHLAQCKWNGAAVEPSGLNQSTRRSYPHDCHGTADPGCLQPNVSHPHGVGVMRLA